jgi:hypothetical protein
LINDILARLISCIEEWYLIKITTGSAASEIFVQKSNFLIWKMDVIDPRPGQIVPRATPDNPTAQPSQALALQYSFFLTFRTSRLDTCLRRAAFGQDVVRSLQVTSLGWTRRKPVGRQGRPKNFLPPLMSERIRATVAVRYCTRKPSVVRIDIDYPIATLVRSSLTREGGRP